MPRRPLVLIVVASALLAGAVSSQTAAPAPETWFVLRDVRLAFEGQPSEGTFDVTVRDGLIEKIVPYAAETALPPRAVAHVLTGKFLLPGIVDAWSQGPERSGPEGQASDTPAETPRQRPAGGRRFGEGAEGGNAGGIESIGDALPSRTFADRGVKPDIRAVDTFAPADVGDVARLRSGVVLQALVPPPSLVAGRGALVTTGTGGKSSVVIDQDSGLHFGFRSARGGYPSTLMGNVAELRQLFFDARRHAEWKRDYTADPSGLQRPPFEPVLEEIGRALRGDAPIVFWCRDANDARRALRLGREFGFLPVIAGETQVADAAAELAGAGAQVLLALNVPDPVYPDNKSLVALEGESSPQAAGGPRGGGFEGRGRGGRGRFGGRGRRDADAPNGPPRQEGAPQEGTGEGGPDSRPESRPDSRPESKPAPTPAEEALAAWVESERQRRTAIEREDLMEVLTAPKRLADAGVPFAFCTGSRTNGTDILRAARLAVKHGLPEELARRALRGVGLTYLREALDVTTFSSGRAATFVITDGALLAPKTRLEGAVVDGRYYSFASEPRGPSGDSGAAAGADPLAAVLGEWSIEIRGFGRPGTATLVRSENGFGGTISNEETSSKILDGTLVNGVVRFSVEYTMGGATFTVRAKATLDGDQMRGTVEAPEMGTLDFTARRSGKGRP